jgi:hypothetical protein
LPIVLEGPAEQRASAEGCWGIHHACMHSESTAHHCWDGVLPEEERGTSDAETEDYEDRRAKGDPQVETSPARSSFPAVFENSSELLGRVVLANARLQRWRQKLSYSVWLGSP